MPLFHIVARVRDGNYTNINTAINTVNQKYLAAAATITAVHLLPLTERVIFSFFRFYVFSSVHYTALLLVLVLLPLGLARFTRIKYLRSTVEVRDMPAPCPVLLARLRFTEFEYSQTSYSILPCPIHPLLSFLILSHPALSCPVLSYPTLPYPTLSYPILSYPILSYPTLPCPVL